MSIRIFAIAKIIFFIYIYFLVSADKTDADFVDRETIRNHQFQATTLDFSNRKTSNQYPISNLFEISGLIPNGFGVASVRIKKDGEMDFNCNIKSEQTSGLNEACKALKLKVMNNWQFIYQGALSEFDLDVFVDNKKDLIFIVSYDQGSYNGEYCAFDLNFKTWLESKEEKGGFYHEQTLHNHISFGKGY